ncbi:MAG TPA: hypothetical protein VFD44_05615, partial [Hanamia sp.]|nr:hypothetical protein [Hanamia sp.]
KKEDGGWKVAFDISTLTDMANKKMQEHGMDGMGNIDSGAIRQKMDSMMNNMRMQPAPDSNSPQQ